MQSVPSAGFRRALRSAARHGETRHELGARGTSRGLALVALSSLALSCSTTRLLDRPLTPPEPSCAAPPPSALTQRVELARPGALEPELQRLLQQVSALRGLASPPVLEQRTLSAPALAQAALANVARDWPVPARRAQAQLLECLGLLPARSDLLALLAPAFEAQLQAFYARSNGVPTLFVARSLTGKARSRALAHELVHALQDQEHALSLRLADESISADRRSVLHALAEADALTVVERLGLAEEEAPGDAADEAAHRPPGIPAVLLRSLAAPYLDGRAWLAEALAAGGFAAVDRALRAPPASTHELLHPRSSAERVAPLPELPAPGVDWQSGYADVLGEQSLRVLLEEGELARAAELAAAWRADRISTFQSAEQSALLWQLELASPAAAANVQSLFQRGLQQRGLLGERAFGASDGSESALPEAEWTCGAYSDTSVVATARRGPQVLLAALTSSSQIVPAAAQCGSLRQWLERTRLGPRPGYAEPHRSPRTRQTAVLKRSGDPPAALRKEQ